VSSRFLTAEDVRRAAGQEILVDAATVVTPQALEVAAQSGVTIRTASGNYAEPTPFRGPDAPQVLDERAGAQGAQAGDKMVVTCVGRNRAGVLAEVCTALAEDGANINDVSQKMVEDYFHMLLVVEMPQGLDFSVLKNRLESLGGDEFVVRVMHERVFQYMHRV
jgi:ACT domain-containing protein